MACEPFEDRIRCYYDVKKLGDCAQLSSMRHPVQPLAVHVSLQLEQTNNREVRTVFGHGSAHKRHVAESHQEQLRHVCLATRGAETERCVACIRIFVAP